MKGKMKMNKQKIKELLNALVDEIFDDKPEVTGRISPRQITLMRKICNEHGWDWQKFETKVMAKFNKTVQFLSKNQASDLISSLIKENTNGNKNASYGRG
jgi:hypothetical protein